MKKKGSHVGIIASFGIFMLFLAGIFIVLEPAFESQKDKDLFVDYLELKLREEFQGNLTTVLVDHNESAKCPFINETIIGFSIGEDYVFKNSTGILPSTFEQDTSDIIVANYTPKGILWLYYSNISFVNKESWFPLECSGNYYPPKISSIKKEKIIFGDKIRSKLGDFDSLKEEIKVPGNLGYSVGFQFANGTVIEAGNRTIREDVFVEEIPLQYMNENATVLSGRLIIKIW